MIYLEPPIDCIHTHTHTHTHIHKEIALRKKTLSCMKLEGIMLSEISQTDKNTYFMVLLICVIFLKAISKE